MSFQGQLYSIVIPGAIFGGLSAAGGFAVLLLPETMKVHLPQTLTEGDTFGGDIHLWKCMRNRYGIISRSTCWFKQTCNKKQNKKSIENGEGCHTYGFFIFFLTMYKRCRFKCIESFLFHWTGHMSEYWKEHLASNAELPQFNQAFLDLQQKEDGQQSMDWGRPQAKHTFILEP